MTSLEDMKVSVVITEKTNLVARFQRTENRQLCPECGANMTVVDCRRENGALFVWYGCTRNGCSGQWLKKISNTLPSSIEKVI